MKKIILGMTVALSTTTLLAADFVYSELTTSTTANMSTPNENVLLWEKPARDTVLLPVKNSSGKIIGYKNGPIIESDESYLARLPYAQKWSQKVYEVLKTEARDLLKDSPAKDMGYFCPNYNNLKEYQRALVWGQIVASISQVESSWNPTTRSMEPCDLTAKDAAKKCYDSVTHKRVFSEGLMQLSYQDTANYSDSFNCRLDYKKDLAILKELAPLEAEYAIQKARKKAGKENNAKELYAKIYNRKKDTTMLNPLNNLRCGILIMNKLVTKTNNIKLTKPYWSTLAEPGAHKYSKVSWIANQTKSFKFCSK